MDDRGQPKQAGKREEEICEFNFFILVQFLHDLFVRRKHMKEIINVIKSHLLFLAVLSRDSLLYISPSSFIIFRLLIFLRKTEINDVIRWRNGLGNVFSQYMVKSNNNE